MFKTLESGEQEVVVQQVLPAPTNGIFYPMFGQLPPTPFPPNPDLELPVYFWGEGIFLYDDEYLDLGGLRAAGIPLFDTGNNISKSSGNESFMMLLGESRIAPSTPCSASMECGGRRSRRNGSAETFFRRVFFKSAGAAPPSG